MSSEQYLLGGSKGGSPMIGVKVDRCCNRYWRMFLFLGILALSLIVAGTLLSSSKEEEQLINSGWREHWSEAQSMEQAKKTVLEQQGRNVVQSEETFGDYLEELDDDKDSIRDENEYYDVDKPDHQKGAQDYFNQAQYDEQAAGRFNPSPAPIGVVPEITDYSLKNTFKTMFRQPLQETIKFDSQYRNPCWSESIPKYPYRSNSYLTVSQQARLLDPEFQQMRRKFAIRNATGDGWRLRCLPYYYVMETPPQAVPSLFTVLGYHPFVVNPVMSEPEFWNLRGPDNTAKLQDYLDIYDNAAESIRENTTNVEKDGKMEVMHKRVTGDGTSSYLWSIDNWRLLPGNENMDEPVVTAADLIKSLTPTAKIIIVLRNPTERLFQGYLQRTEDPSAADFHKKVGEAMEAMSKCEEMRSLRSCLYDSKMNKRLKVRLRIGMYYPFVEDYIEAFGKDQVKVIRYEDYVKSTSQVISEVCSFLGLMPYPLQDLAKAEEQVQIMEKRRKESATFPMMSSTRAMLKEFHKVLNEKLAEILGDDSFTWPEQSIDDATLDVARSQFQQQQEEQQQKQASEQQTTTAANQDNKPKTFQEMLEKIKQRQKLAIEMQNKLRMQQMEKMEQLRKERAQQNQQRPPGAPEQQGVKQNQLPGAPEQQGVKQNQLPGAPQQQGVQPNQQRPPWSQQQSNPQVQQSGVQKQPGAQQQQQQQQRPQMQQPNPQPQQQQPRQPSPLFQQ